ncbi:MAG: hypothetical protein CL814_06375 [Confluentimicrobium sp.]|jgi:uncharacterized membrane protein|uniref:Putative membrane protein n=1 Tax=Actibacterium naphthalenivorans TaxID=1614693 RepID=A0A840CF91_9RHOB|nr:MULTISPECIES: hypothetical protein [Actibacterium]ALG91368.1 hypothetical protein TQ29_15695 [Actibacterium sp. EMB200-NS6]MBB4022782.1 putative membrane protein [Actibacterium naphthalenivorans]MBC56545.1 hypothetical protein [Actibacterium sp.]MDY6859802.1 hypothetical protein [Pseudomonadota bacterium]|tara:strand:- start:1346 stop:1756 length:411 start_codon:yes stop_codon:yes gene_type:complete
MTEQEYQPHAEEERREFAAESESLWRLTLAPVTWALHLVLCYATVSLACARQLFPVDTARIWLIGATVLALALIGWQGWRALQQWNVRNTGALSHPEGKAEDRHQFLGHATFLIALISAIGTVFTSLPLLLLEGCR